MLTCVTYASIKCANFNLVSSCDNFQCSSHLCLLFLFILSLLDPVDHQSLNHQTFTPTDSLRAPSAMSGGTYSMYSALYLPTDGPLPRQNIFLHHTRISKKLCKYGARLPCKTAEPARNSLPRHFFGRLCLNY